METNEYGYWTVLERPAGRKWLCRCICGTERMVEKYNLFSGGSTNCGCKQRENAVETGKKNRRHGMAGTPTHRSWVEMRRRCRSPERHNAKYYSKQGVSVCPEWNVSFEAFLRDMGERPSMGHTLDRFPDKNGNYEPGNCRWATAREQALNRRKRHSKLLPRP